MNMHEYSELAALTAIYPDRGNNLIYPVLGLCGEMGELIGKLTTDTEVEDLLKEFGDVLWYINTCCFELGISFPPIETLVDSDKISTQVRSDMDWMRSMCFQVGSIAEATKKTMIRDGSEITEKFRQDMKILLCSVYQYLCYYVEHIMNITMGEIAYKNIYKLFNRKIQGTIGGSGDDR